MLINPISSTQLILAEGNSTEKSFVEISNSDELAEIEEDLTENYILTEDIDLKDAEWEPIDEDEFTGTLTGDDFVIQNMPAKYIKDENLGLFAEVEDIDNIDVDVEFVEEVKEDSKEKPKKEPKEEPKKESKKVQEETAKEKESTEIETKEDAQENSKKQKKAKEDSKDAKLETTKTRAGFSGDATSFAMLKSLLEDPKITEINLQTDIDERSHSNNQIEIAPRDFVLNGNGYELKQNSAGIADYAMMTANLEADKEAEMIFRNVAITTQNKNSFITQTGTAHPDQGWTVIFEDVNKEQFTPSNGRLVTAADAHVKLKGEVNFIGDVRTIFREARSVTVESGAKANFLTKGLIYEGVSNGAELNIEEGALLGIEAGSGDKPIIEMTESNSKINVNGGTLNITSSRDYEGIATVSQTKTGLIRFTKDDVGFNVTNNGTVDVKHGKGSILFMESDRGKINVTGGSTVDFDVKGGNGNHDAAIHLNTAKEYLINVDGGSRLNIEKQGGRAMGLRVGEGPGHKISVKGASRFSIHNVGNGTPADPFGNRARNQALYYNSDLPEFIVEEDDSEVSLVADNGVAMHMTGGGIIKSTKGTSFIAHGKTASANRGIIDTGGKDDKANSLFKMEHSAFYDFRNNNTDGFVFHVGNQAQFQGLATDIAVWDGKNGDLDGPHTWRLIDINFEYGDADFKDLKFSDRPYLTTNLNTANGLQEYARISGNNGYAIVNDLYQPTDADQKIYAQVSVDEGIFNTRDVYTGEAEVDITHTKADGTEQILTGKAIGKDSFPGEEAFKIYGKSTLVDKENGMNGFGWAEIILPDDAYLEKGDTIKVTGAKFLDSDENFGRVNPSLPEHLFGDTLTVVDVTPPELAVVESGLTDHSSKPQIIEGKSLEDGVEVSVEVNGQDAKGEIVYDRENGKFTYTFKQKLEVGNKVQIFLNDMAGRAQDLGPDADRPDRPETNLDSGNINPEETYTYHDKDFVKGTIIGVVESTGELVFESAPENLNFKVKVKSYTDEYLVELAELGKGLVISDDRPDKADWKLTAKMDKQLTEVDGTDVLPDALIYRDGDINQRLTDEDAIVRLHEYASEDAPDKEWDLSSNWGKGENGMFIEIEPGTKKTDYKGQVKWTLHDAP